MSSATELHEISPDLEINLKINLRKNVGSREQGSIFSFLEI